jgi:hypothetical protein
LDIRKFLDVSRPTPFSFAWFMLGRKLDMCHLDWLKKNDVEKGVLRDKTATGCSKK